MRVTALSQTTQAIAQIEQQNSAYATTANQISSGIAVAVPSDNPTAFSQISDAKTTLGRLATYTNNITTATATLNNSVSTLTSVNNLLVTAQSLAQQGADSSTNNNQTNRNALATQINSLLNQAIGAANSQPNGQSLYAGTATTTLPFSVATTNASGQPATIVYNGSTQSTSTITGQNQTVNTQYDGSSVYQKSGADVFQALIQLRDTLQDPTVTGPALSAAVNTQITNLTAARTQIQNVEGQQTADLATLQTLSNATSSAQTNAQQRVTSLQGTDYASAVVQLQAQQTSLQAIYSVTAQILQPGFLNYLSQATA